MGVHGLWELLAPVGRRVSVEALSGKTLAIDASIWIVQFMKAMRDDKGEMMRNAHLLGFFRRICKLLYLKTKPVFVFDGGTPALKRRTVIARRRQRENAQAKVRKMAEKLLLNQIKRMKLKELKMDLLNQREMSKNVEKGKKEKRKKMDTDCSEDVLHDHKENNLMSDGSQENAVVENLEKKASTSSGCVFTDIDKEKGDVITLDVCDKSNHTLKGKGILYDSSKDIFSDGNNVSSSKLSQRELDEMLAASLAADDSENLSRMDSAAFIDENVEGVHEDEGDDEELVLPAHWNVDPSILASLPPSVQLDLLVQMRERLMAENRQRYQAVKKAPEKFSEMQIEAYLKTVAFRKEIDEVQKNATGKVANGVQTSRIASEANREFIFSSSYSGDKRLITPVSSRSGDTNKDPLEQSSVPLVSKSSLGTDACRDQVAGTSGVTDRTKVDRRRYTRANKMKTMGIRMTRDLQRNLDMIKEIEMDELQATKSVTEKNSQEVLENVNAYATNCEVVNDEVISGDAFLRISFDADDSQCANSDEELFNRLASGKSGVGISRNIQISDCSSESRGGDEFFDEQSKGSIDNGSSSNHDSEVEWEEGECTKSSASSFLPHKTRSKGEMEEDAELQIAIKLSLADAKGSHDRIEIDDDSFIEEDDHDANGSDENIFETSVAGNSEFKAKTENKSFESIQFDEEKQRLSSTLSNVDFAEGKSIGTSMCSPASNTQMLTTCSYVSEQSSSRLDENDKARVTILLDDDEAAAKNSDVPQRDESCELNTEFRCVSRGEEHAEPAAEETDFDAELKFVEQEYKNLGKEQRKLERNADSVNNEMFVECQELLQMFGLPYVIAPMEAEAQCAYMEAAGLVDGIVTDDSDVFLFGGRNVYKNIFDDRKYVETYFMQDVEKELGLSREKLIRMTLLLGSDYTEGVSGVGIVNAIEIVHAFDSEDGLRIFREWIESPDPAILGKFVRKKPVSTNEDEDLPDVPEMRRVFMDKHRNVSKNWHFPPSFPSDAVVAAYTCAQVDKSTEPFSWGKPDILVLQRLCWEKFGWDDGKSRNVLQPVLTAYDKREIQLRLDAFYSFNERFAKIRSKRIKNALKGVVMEHPHGDPPDGNGGDGHVDGRKASRKRSKKEAQIGTTGMDESSGKRSRRRAGKKAMGASSDSDANRSVPPERRSPGMRRRSTRAKMRANYAEDDVEDNVADGNTWEGENAVDGEKCCSQAAIGGEQDAQGIEDGQYLKVGGGFCVAEEGVSNDANAPSFDVAAASDASDRHFLPTPVASELRPMPFLKRKRRSGS